MVDPIFINN